MSTHASPSLGRTRHVRVVTFRVSKAERAALEREAVLARTSVNALARERALRPHARVDIEESAPDAPAPRDLAVVYDDEGRSE